MGRMTSSCMNCGGVKEQGEFLNDYCSECMSAVAGAEAAAQAENGDTAAARRRALADRAHIAHRNFVDPRAIDRRTMWLTGNIPAGQKAE